MAENPSLTKTCAGCGLEKPLTAFLQMAGPEGTMYGSLCATCRSGKVDKVPVVKEKEGSTTDTTGFKIDSKAKAKIDHDKQAHRKEIEEKYREEREKIKSDSELLKDKKEKKQESEKQHRKDFLQAPRSYISTEKAPDKKGAGPAAAKTGSIYQQLAQGKEEKAKLDRAVKEDLQAKGFDPQGEQRPSQTGALLKYGASFRAWLAANPHTATAKAFGLDKSTQTNEKANKKETKAELEKAKEFAKDNFTSPGSRRGRS